MKAHTLKTHREYFLDVYNGTKTFEVRKNDRNFKIKDILILMPVDAEHLTEIPNAIIVAEITYILPGGKFGIEEDYVVLGIKIILKNMIGEI